MPSSRPNHIPLVVNILRQLAPTSILDVGVGFGKWGFLFREYMDIIKSENNPARYHKGNWQVRIDGIEGFPEYLTEVHEYIYDKVHVGDMTTVIDELDPYDVIFAGDVIEHVQKQVGVQFIQKCIGKAKKALVLSTPARPIAQGPVCGNALEVHQSFWSREEFQAIGPCKTKISEDDILVAVFVPPGARFPRLTSRRRKSEGDHDEATRRTKRRSRSDRQWARYKAHLDNQCATIANNLALTSNLSAKVLSELKATQKHLSEAIATHRGDVQESLRGNQQSLSSALEKLRQNLVESVSSALSTLPTSISAEIAQQNAVLFNELSQLIGALNQQVNALSEAQANATQLNNAANSAEAALLQTLNRIVDQRVSGLLEAFDHEHGSMISARQQHSPGLQDGLMLSLRFTNAPIAIVLPRKGLKPEAARMPGPSGSESVSATHGTGRPTASDEYNHREEPDGASGSGYTISVVMTTYNSAAYVRKSVLNVLEQSHRDIELIIVDDASTDNTFEVLSELARDDSRVRLIKMFQNRGTYWCKNYGITRSTGRYLTFQDSDDISDSDRLRLQLEELQQTKAVMCTCNYVRVNDADGVVMNRGREQRKAIMAPLLDKDEVIRRAGYFDSVRTSADDEFNRRIGIVFGQGRICHIDMPLYRATVRAGSLTNDDRTRADISGTDEDASDKSFLSTPRREYVRQYTAWHERIKQGAEPPRIDFPQLRRRFPAPARLLPERHQQESYVTASMASMPSRLAMLKQTVASILPQIDFLNVYLNGYENTPAFLCDAKIQVIHSREYGDLRDNGKFFFLDSILHGYHFTIDDDIIYPPDYVQRVTLKIEQYDRQAIVGCHGVNLANPIVQFMKGREVIHFKQASTEDRFVNLLGTGTIAYHINTIKLSRDDFREPGMADLWFAVAAKRQRIPMVAIERPAGWLKPIIEADETSLYRAATNNDGVQTAIAANEEPWALETLWQDYDVANCLLSRFSSQELKSQGVDARLITWCAARRLNQHSEVEQHARTSDLHASASK
jgi:hypothetical protein